MSDIVKDLLDKLRQCDDFHNRCDYLLEHSEISYLLGYIQEQEKEIKRLNNIINEIEKHFEFLKMNSTGGNKEFMEDILGFIKALKELKGSDKE